MANTVIKVVKGNVLRLDIPLQVKIRNTEDGEPTERTEDFYPSLEYPVVVKLTTDYKTVPLTAEVDGNVVKVEDRGTLKAGCYQVEVICQDDNGNPYRFAEPCVIHVVNYTKDAGIEAGVEFDSESYTLEGAYFIQGEKGDKGDPFTWEDFTEEEILLLQKPAQDKANEVTELQEQWTEAETQRSQAEQGREQAEGTRQTTFEQNEQARQTTFSEYEQQRQVTFDTNEQARQADFSAKMEQADVAIEKGEHPDYVGEDNYIYRYNMTLHQYVRTNIYVKGDKGDKGDPGKDFSIYKTYASISAMNADKDNVPLTEFVLIASTVEDPDNAKLFVRSNDAPSGFVYLTDLSGAQGIKGDRGYSSYEIAVQHGYTGSEAEYNALYFDAVSSANAAAGLANEKAVLAATAAANADAKATLANDAAILANTKAGLADTAATEAGRVNASVSGTVISVTNRQGQTSQADVGFALVKNISVDYRLNADTVQWTNLYGAITITRLVGVNVSSVKLSYGSVIEQVVSLGTVDIDIADGDVVTMKIVRTSDLQEASVSVRIEQAQGSSSE